MKKQIRIKRVIDGTTLTETDALRACIETSDGRYLAEIDGGHSVYALLDNIAIIGYPVIVPSNVRYLIPSDAEINFKIK